MDAATNDVATSGHGDGCPGMWRLATVDAGRGGAETVYVCELCGGRWEVHPGGQHPRSA